MATTSFLCIAWSIHTQCLAQYYKRFTETRMYIHTSSASCSRYFEKNHFSFRDFNRILFLIAKEKDVSVPQCLLTYALRFRA
ncbi:hypothetical protein F4825DRAFT_403986 [Nemania diffusa]|nr:hypothetical protein F4825DRAFT_403986 [Nemania diffusa]